MKKLFLLTVGMLCTITGIMLPSRSFYEENPHLIHPPKIEFPQGPQYLPDPNSPEELVKQINNYVCNISNQRSIALLPSFANVRTALMQTSSSLSSQSLSQNPYLQTVQECMQQLLQAVTNAETYEQSTSKSNEPWGEDLNYQYYRYIHPLVQIPSLEPKELKEYKKWFSLRPFAEQMEELAPIFRAIKEYERDRRWKTAAQQLERQYLDSTLDQFVSRFFHQNIAPLAVPERQAWIVDRLRKIAVDIREKQYRNNAFFEYRAAGSNQ